MFWCAWRRRDARFLWVRIGGHGIDNNICSAVAPCKKQVRTNAMRLHFWPQMVFIFSPGELNLFGVIVLAWLTSSQNQSMIIWKSRRKMSLHRNEIKKLNTHVNQHRKKIIHTNNNEGSLNGGRANHRMEESKKKRKTQKISKQTHQTSQKCRWAPHHVDAENVFYLLDSLESPTMPTNK